MLGLGLPIIKQAAGGGGSGCYYIDYRADIDTITADSNIESADYSLNFQICTTYLRMDTAQHSADTTAYKCSATKE